MIDSLGGGSLVQTEHRILTEVAMSKVYLVAQFWDSFCDQTMPDPLLPTIVHKQIRRHHCMSYMVDSR